MVMMKELFLITCLLLPCTSIEAMSVRPNSLLNSLLSPEEKEKNKSEKFDVAPLRIIGVRETLRTDLQAEVIQAQGRPQKQLPDSNSPLSQQEQAQADNFINFVINLDIFNTTNPGHSEDDDNDNILPADSADRKALAQTLHRQLAVRKLLFNLKKYPRLLDVKDELIEEICKLRFLEKLSLASFRLTEFPFSILNLNLKYLSLARNPIYSLPRHDRFPHFLRVLILDDTLIQYLPISLLDSRDLQILSLFNTDPRQQVSGGCSIDQFRRHAHFALHNVKILHSYPSDYCIPVCFTYRDIDLKQELNDVREAMKTPILPLENSSSSSSSDSTAEKHMDETTSTHDDK